MAFRECRDGLALGQATEQMSGSERDNNISGFPGKGKIRQKHLVLKTELEPDKHG
jgi:hypothetical protein